MRKAFYFLWIIPCLLFFSQAMHAQTISAGVKGGISIPNLTTGGSSNPLNSGYSTRVGADAALFVEYPFSSLFSVEVSLEYSSQGGKKNGKQALPVPEQVASQFPPGQAPPYLWANFNGEAKLNYLMLPILGKFSFYPGSGSAWKVYIDAGPFVALLLSGKTVTSGSSNVYADEGETIPLLPGPTSFDATMDVKDSLHAANVGVEANIGIAYTMGSSTFFLEGGANYGFINIQKNKDDGQNNTGAATIRIGYAYSFGGNSKGAKSVKEPNKF